MNYTKHMRKRKLQKLLLKTGTILLGIALLMLLFILIDSCNADSSGTTKNTHDHDTTTSVETEEAKISELEIISLFSGSNPDEGAEFLQIIGDSKGLPTIQEVDACWKFMYMHFHVSGYVSNDGINKIFVDDISNYVTEKLGGDPTKVFTKGKAGNEEIASLSIYIERTLAEEISVKVFNQNVNHLFGTMSLTYNQKLAIGEQIWLGAWHGGLTDTWEKAEKLYTVGSEEFNLYIWDNFWYSLVKKGTETGSAKASDVLFELFVNDQLPQTSSDVYNRTQTTYYTEAQLQEIGAIGLKPGR